MADLTRKTANLFDKTGTVYQAYLTDTQWLANEDSTSVKIPCLPNTTYTISVATELPIFRIATSDDKNIQPQNPINIVIRLAYVTQNTFTTSSTAQVIIFQGSKSMVNTWLDELMVNVGSTAKPYEPYGWVHSLRKLTTATEAVENPLYSDGTAITAYTLKGNTVQSGTPTPSNPVAVVGVGELETTGEHTGEYKIPISSGQQTIDIYIGDLPLLKSLDGTAVDEISNGTLTRRVDSDGSVLPTPTTTQITMPSIPTTEGANSITVDTTVQPSEFTATWSGWHDSSVKEYDGTDWQ